MGRVTWREYPYEKKVVDSEGTRLYRLWTFVYRVRRLFLGFLLFFVLSAGDYFFFNHRIAEVDGMQIETTGFSVTRSLFIIFCVFFVRWIYQKTLLGWEAKKRASKLINWKTFDWKAHVKRTFRFKEKATLFLLSAWIAKKIFEYFFV